MNYILFLNPWEGLGYVLLKKLEKANIQFEYRTLKTHPKDFDKYKIKSTPVLLVLDGKEISDRLCLVEEIHHFFKNVPDNKV